MRLHSRDEVLLRRVLLLECFQDILVDSIPRQDMMDRHHFILPLPHLQVLPSGRRLSYVKPQIGINRFGGESVTYMGTDSTKKWSKIESYGPKFVENIVQAVSCDILCHSMMSLSGYSIVGHVHDEVILECPVASGVDMVCGIMGRTPPWIPGLLLKADGYECSFYMKL